MSIASTTNRNNYTGNGSVSEYDYTFRIFDDDDLLVTVRNTSNVETTLTKTTDYTVAGVGVGSGGTITLVNSGQAWLTGANLTTGFVISIRRVLPLSQNTDIRNQGDFFPEAHEDEFDRSRMIDQQQQDEIDRSLKLSESINPADFDATIPASVVGQANVTFMTNADGDAIIEGPTANEISSAQGFAESAENWATKIDGAVDGSEFSAKAYAIGGTGVSDTATKGAAKEWAIETSGTVDGTDYSAKEYAQGVQTRGAAGGGSAKDWATYTAGTVNDTEYSAKYWAEDAQATAGALATDLSAIEADIDDLELALPSGDDFLQLEESASPPSTPASGFKRIYADTDGQVYSVDDAGTVKPLGGGGGGGSIIWSEQDLSPIKTILNNITTYDFADGEDQYLYTFLKVPSTYTPGSPINLRSVFHTPATTGTVLFSTRSTLIRTGTDAVTSTTNQRTSTNTATTVNGTANVATAVTCDLTDASGQINAVAVSAGDLIVVRMTRNTTTDTAADSAFLYADGSEVSYA